MPAKTAPAHSSPCFLQGRSLPLLLILLLTLFSTFTRASDQLSQQEIDSLVAATSAISEVSEQIKALNENRTLENLTKFTDALDGLAAAGPALGLLSAGIGVANLALQGEDPVFTAVKQLDASVSRLHEAVERGFDRLQDQQDYTGIRQNLLIKYSELGAAREAWKSFTAEPGASTPSFAKYKTDFFETRASAISSFCAGPGRDNLFRGVANDTYGNIESATTVGGFAVTNLAQAKMMWSSAKFLEMRQLDANRALTDVELSREVKQRAETLMGRYLLDCESALQSEVKRLQKSSELATHAEVFLDDVVLESFDKDTWGRAGTADSIASIMEANYPQREWLAIVYAPVRRFNSHFYKGPHLDRKGATGADEDGMKRNLVIHYWVNNKKYSIRKWRSKPLALKLKQGRCRSAKPGPNCMRVGDIRAMEEVLDYYSNYAPVTHFEWFGRTGDVDIAHTGPASHVFSQKSSNNGLSYVVRMKKQRSMPKPPPKLKFLPRQNYSVRIDCDVTGIGNEFTDNTIKATFYSKFGRRIGSAKAGPIKDRIIGCGGVKDVVIAASTLGLASNVKISTNGGDAFMIDKISIRRGDRTLREFGKSNDKGWCLSTEKKDAHGGWKGHVAGNKCRQSIDWDF